jgi:hypothetical protein
LAEWLQIYYSGAQITICWAKLLHIISYGSEEEMQQEQMGKSSSGSCEKMGSNLMENARVSNALKD